MLLCSIDIYNWISPAGLLRETKPLLAQVIGWNSGIHWFFRQNEPFLGLSGTFVNLIWLHTPMATPPKRWRWSKLHQRELHLGGLVTPTPMVNATGESVCLEKEFPHPKASVQCTVGFYLAVHFPWKFTGHFSTPLHPSPLRTKDGFAASRMCWYFTKIDTKIGVLMIHQNGDSTISSQHLKRNKARLKTSSTASKQVCNLLSFP